MELLSAFFLGFFVKVITGIDDVVTRIPVIAAITRTRMGKIAFCVGTVCAVSVATGIAFFFSAILQSIPAYRYVVSGLIFLLAGLIYFNVFVQIPKSKAAETISKYTSISFKRSLQLFGIGFIASFTTVLDDVIAFFPLFLLETNRMLMGIAGILVATLIQSILVIYFSEKIAKIPYKEKIAVVGLLCLGVATLLEWV